MLHGVTLFFIFAIIAATAYSLKLVKENKERKAQKFDMIAAQFFLLVYVLLNIYFIFQAN
jgi:ABC-type Co2+ transport system permease subunit